MSPEELWESCVGLAKSMAYKRSRRFGGNCTDDLLQAALLALWKAANAYCGDDHPDTQFATYAWYHVRGELNCECWRQGIFGFKAGKAVSYGKCDWLPARQPMPQDNDNDESELIPSIHPGTDFTDDRELLEFIIQQLAPQKLRAVARWYWLEGLSSATVAHRLNLSVIRIQQLHKIAYTKMVEIADTLKRAWEREAS